ncbi:acyltransferase [Stenotrophomonas rhizophila]|nr:acyltransferase [Stenotrophomonas rhizophila]
MKYVAGLDGLRAIAMLVVLAFHARVSGMEGGYLSVDLFFVLSGYLITRILAEQHSVTGRIALGDFYVRRLRRLYPALLFFLAAYLVFAPLAFPKMEHHVRDAAVAAVYLSDYGFAFWRIPWLLQHTWSLSVEEHFYLAWPIALILILKLPERWHVRTILGLAIVATLWRWHITFTVDQWQQPYYRFDTRLSGLLLGSAVGIWRPKVPRLAPFVGVAMLLVAMSMAIAKHPAGLRQWMTAAEVGSILLVLSADRISFLAWSPLVWIGKLSYGIYLWHYPFVYWLRRHDVIGWEAFALAGSGAVLCAAISYYTVEAWAKARRSGRAHGVEAARAGQV